MSYQNQSSNESTTTNKTNKTINKEYFRPNKKNPAYIYLMEIQRFKGKNKKRNHTARTNNKRLILPNTINKNPWNTPIRNIITVDKKINQFNKKKINLIDDSKNLNNYLWPNIMPDTRFKTEIGVKGFINGVPIIESRKKKENNNFYENNNNYNINKMNKKSNINYERDINKNGKEFKDRNNSKEKNKNNNFNIKELGNSKSDELFNTNQKNFYKFRKDIIEQPEYEEDDGYDIIEVVNKLKKQKEEEEKLKNKNEINDIKNQRKFKRKKGKSSIQFPEIYKYFRKVAS